MPPKICAETGTAIARVRTSARMSRRVMGALQRRGGGGARGGGVEAGGVEADAGLRLGKARQGADGQGGAEDLAIVPIGLVLQPQVTDLIQAAKAVPADGRAIG